MKPTPVHPSAQRFPLLWRAHQQRRAELASERAQRRRCRDLLIRLERLVAHRELQLARACSTGSRSYLAKREAKLRAAQGALDDTRALARRIGA